MNKAKEKNKNKNTKEKKLLDLDNEIIIGIKTLPEPEVPKRKKGKKTTKSSSTAKKKSKQKNDKKERNQKSSSNNGKNRASSNNKRKKVDQEDEFELKLGIEDESIKKKIKKTTVKRKTAKQQEIEKQKRKRIFRIIKWTTLVVLLIGGGISFLLSPYFNIKEITTSGNEKIKSEELISLSGIEQDINMFKISSGKIEQAIKNNAYIESVNIKRKLPNSIEIQVVERKPAYMLTLGNAYVYVNKQGYLLEISKESQKLPILVGISTPEDQISEGKRLCTEDLERLNSVIQIMDSANNNDIGKLVTKINISDKQDYVLEMKSEKKTVHVGNTSNLSTKMLYVKTVLQKEKKKEGEIFVNTDLNTKGAIFREKV